MPPSVFFPIFVRFIKAFRVSETPQPGGSQMAQSDLCVHVLVCAYPYMCGLLLVFLLFLLFTIYLPTSSLLPSSTLPSCGYMCVQLAEEENEQRRRQEQMLLEKLEQQEQQEEEEETKVTMQPLSCLSMSSN